MTLQEFVNFFKEAEFMRTFLIMLTLYFVLIVPGQENENLQLAIFRGVVLVFVFCCGWWAIGNYDIVFSVMGLR